LRLVGASAERACHALDRVDDEEQKEAEDSDPGPPRPGHIPFLRNIADVYAA
jgi:hypothetical protein